MKISKKVKVINSIPRWKYIVEEKVTPEHKIVKNGGYKVYLATQSFFLRDLEQMEKLSKFLRMFVKEQEGGEKDG